MRIDRDLFRKVLIAALLGVNSQAMAQDADLGVVPYLHPRPCQLQMDTSGFSVFPSEDCGTVFIGPNPIEKPVHSVRLEAGIAFCEDNALWHESLILLDQLALDLTKKGAEAIKNGKNEKGKYYLDQAKEARADYLEAKAQYDKLASLPGATVQSLFDNSVRGEDHKNFMQQNLFLFWNSKEEERPVIQTLRTEDSIFSFTHYRPEMMHENLSSIISTTIPGLQVLVQPSAQMTNVAHVKAGDVVSGETRLSLYGACPMVQKNADSGEWELKPQAVDKVMTVNRTYNVPVKVGYGIKASLNSAVATKVLSNLVINNSTHGLSKSQFYEELMAVDGEEAFSVTLDTDASGLISPEEREYLMVDVRQRLLDRFLKYYEDRGDLAHLTPVDLGVPASGFVPVNKVGTHCWKKKKLFGGGSSGCYDYVYTVQEWREGKNETDIQNYLNVNLKISEETHVNDIIKLPMSTAFFDSPDILSETLN